MLDRHQAIANLNEGTDGTKSVTYLSLFDGHAGLHFGLSQYPFSCLPAWTSAAYAVQKVHEKLLTEEVYHEHNYDDALKQVFLSINKVPNLF